MFEAHFSINRKPTFINGPRNLPRNPPACIILDILVFENFILADKLFAKAFGKFEQDALIDLPCFLQTVSKRGKNCFKAF